MRSLFIILIAITTLNVRADPLRVLTPLELFSRCYSHITQLRLPSNHPLKATVTSNATAVQACMTILSEANLNPTTGKIAISSSTNTTATERLAILRNFQNLHVNFPTNTDITIASPNASSYSNARTAYDETEFSLYFTRALFSSTIPVSEIVTGTAPVEAVRSNGRYTGGPTLGVQTGDFLGVKLMPSDKINATVNIDPDGVIGGITSSLVNKHQGGGVIGSQVYAALNFGLNTQKAPDNGLIMPRRWSRAVFKDLLCRDVPVIRAGDPSAMGYIQTTNTAGAPSFRNAAACVQCHASMDPMAGVVRNFAFDNAQTTNGGEFLLYYAPTLSESAFNPFVNSDANFYKKTPNGILRFRSYDGTLIEKNVSGAAQLGAEIANTNDFYACVASRYFKYFTGVTVSLQDIGDTNLPQLSTADLHYRNLVIGLGQTLKTDKSIQNLIKNILLSVPYQNKSLRSGGN